MSRLLYRLQAKPGGAESLLYTTLQGLGVSQKTQNWKKARASGHKLSLIIEGFQPPGSSEHVLKKNIVKNQRGVPGVHCDHCDSLLFLSG